MMRRVSSTLLVSEEWLCPTTRRRSFLPQASWAAKWYSASEDAAVYKECEDVREEANRRLERGIG